MLDALITMGYLRIRLSEAMIAALHATYENGYLFFRAPDHEKALNRLPEDCGYRPMGVEYSQSPERPDPFESFTASKRVRPCMGELPSKYGMALYDQMLQTIDLWERLAESLTMQLADNLTGRSFVSLLKGMFSRWSCLQLNYSRPSAVTTPFIHEPHEDGHLMTIASATKPGLEVESTNDVYTPLFLDSDEVIIMPGEILALLTGYQIKPLYHRVRPDTFSKERLALLFFADIDPKLCQPWILNESNMNVDIGSRVLTNARRFGTEAFSIEQEPGSGRM